MSETFEEYWNEVKPKSQRVLPIEEGVAMQAWFHQQKKIDDLEKRLSALDNTGMIGSSPAQFMEKINELQLKNDAQAKMLRGQQATNKKLAQVTKERNELLELVAEANDLFNLIYEGEYKVDSFTAQPYRQLLEKIKETK